MGPGGVRVEERADRRELARSTDSTSRVYSVLSRRLFGSALASAGSLRTSLSASSLVTASTRLVHADIPGVE